MRPLTTAIAFILFFSVAPLAYGSQAPSPQALWHEIQDLKQVHAIMPGSKPLQPGSRAADYFTTDLSNQPADKAMAKAGGILKVHRYPGGALVVKENFAKDKKPTGVTAMLKLKGYDSADRDWVMAAYDPRGKILAYGKMGSCIACHAMVRKPDLVFAPPPTQLLPLSTWKAFFRKQEISPVYAHLLKTHAANVMQ